jgi:hypothetical protein
VKINEIITEAWGAGIDPTTGRATGVLGRLASDFVGADNYSATANWAKDKMDKAKMKRMTAAASSRTPDELANTIRADLPNTVDQMITPDAGTSPENKFLKQWEIVDNDPPTVTHQNATYQRDEHGKWIDFKTGKIVPTRISQTLDRVSPPTGTTTAIDQLPAGAIDKPNQPPVTQKPAVWRSNRPAAPAEPEPTTTAPSAQKMPRFGRNADGSIIVTDKQNATWTKPKGQDYWADARGAIYRPGSEQYNKLEANLPPMMKQST